MPRLKIRKKTDVTVEKRILTGIITSKEYLQDISPLIDLAYFKSSFIRRVAGWVLDFYDGYNKVPLSEIQSIFNAESPKLKEEEAELISKLLTDISKRYELDQNLNIPYLTDQTEKYFKQRELEITSGNLKVLLERGDIEEAENQISKFKKIQKITSNWINPFSDESIDKTFEQKDEIFFKLPGKLGELTGNMDRNWLVGISGPFKIGKTWFLQEFAVMGIMSNLKVAFFSLEMSEQKTNERLYKRVTGGNSTGGKMFYPCFDCAKNQNNECELEKRVCDEEAPKEISINSSYVPCTVCREDGTKDEKGKNNYEQKTWWEILKFPEFNVNTVGTALKSWQRGYNDLLRIKIYPRFAANIADIKRDLELLEQLEEFVPDIILIDYADILKPENENSVGIDKEDRTWIALAQLAAERHALVVTPTQVTKSGQDAVKLKVEHTAKWVGKLAHVDAMLTLNQTSEEKTNGVMRVGVMMHRHNDFNDEMVTILQNLTVGQANLDSEY